MKVTTRQPRQSANTSTEPELNALMRRYQQGDGAAAEALVRAVSPQLYSFLAFRQSYYSLKEDLLQDCWLEIHRSRHTYQPGRPVLPWIYGIVRNVRCRAARRYKHRIDSERLLTADEDSAILSPDGAAAEILQILNRLPEAQRDKDGFVTLYINFQTGSATIQQDSMSQLEQVAKLLQGDPALKLEVAGHTHNVGTPESNQKLSDARARSVVAAVVKHGVAAERLSPKGYGQTSPIADNRTEEGRARNRRVELVKR